MRKRAQYVHALFLSTILLLGCEPIGSADGEPYEPPVANLSEADHGEEDNASAPAQEGGEDTVVLAFLGRGQIIGSLPGVDKWTADTQGAINNHLSNEGARLRLELRPMIDRREPMQTELGLMDIVLDDAGGANDDIDLFLWDISEMRTFAKEGYVLDITDGLNALPNLYGITPERAWKETQVDGRIYGFPLLNRSNLWERSMYVPMRGSVMDRLGIEAPASPDELINAALAAKERNDESIPYKIFAGGSRPPYALHASYEEWPFFVDEQSRFILYEDGGAEAYIGSDIFYKDCAFYSRCADLGLIAKYTASEHKASVAVLDPWVSVYIEVEANRPDGTTSPKEGEWIMYADLAPGSTHIRISPCADKAIYVSKRCRDARSALLMLEYLYTNREINDALIYGQQGSDWTLDADGTAVTHMTNEWMQDFTHHGFIRQRRGGLYANYGHALDHCSASGFVFNEDTPRKMEWLMLTYSEVWLYREGGYTINNAEGILSDMNDRGYQIFLDEVRRQYAEYIEATQ